MISTGTDLMPVATHVPFIFEERSGTLIAYTHISRANTQSTYLPEGQKVLLIFQGAHTYISSSWYDHPNVPTWDYEVVHLYGTIHKLDERDTVLHLESLMHFHEQHETSPLSFHDLDPDFIQKEKKGLIAYSVTIDEIQAARKLSQNRDNVNLERIIQALRLRNDEMSEQIADELALLLKQRNEAHE